MANQPKTTRQVLEEALAHDPDDVAAHFAYADLLQEQGDPRGEFIWVQLALENDSLPAAERQHLLRRQEELWKKHRVAWMGEMGPHLGEEHFVIRFARGWLADATITELGIDGARLLARAPEARLLRRLQVKTVAWYDLRDRAHDWYTEGDDVPAGEQFPGLYALRVAPWLANLRVCHLGRDRFDPCGADGRGVVGLVERMPRLEELYLLAHRVDVERLFALPMPNLRVLWIYHLEDYPLHILAGNPSLTRLERLELHPHALRADRPYLGIEQLRAITRSPHLPSLRHLEFALSDIGDAGCEEIVGSGLLNRLKVLDVCLGTITDAGARILAECPDLKNLEFLDVSSNSLTEEGIGLLEGTQVKLEASFQHSVEENESDDADSWLCEGDWE
jgi:uncharacterized protein (TIGR02996 family)